MKSLSTFFRTLFRSLFSPQYYADILKANFSFSFKYFFLLNLFLSLVTIAFILIPISLFDVQKFANDAVKVYPSDLVVTVKDNHVSINKPLPYAIPLPADWQNAVKNSNQKNPDSDNLDDSTDSLKDIQNIVVFDSDNRIHGAQDVYADHAFAVITETSFYTRDRQSGMKVNPLPEKMGNMTINSGVIMSLKQSILDMPIVKNKIYVAILGILFLIVLLPMTLFFRFITLLIYSVVVWIIAKIFKKSLLANTELSYGKLLQVSLHSVTPALLLAYLINGLQHSDIVHGWIYFFIYLFWTLVVLHVATKPVVPAEAVKPTPLKPQKSKK